MGLISMDITESESAMLTRHSRCHSSRRREGSSLWLAITLAAVFVCIGTSPAQAQRGAYPSAPVRLVVGFTPGGGVDIIARLLGQKMSGIWGQPVIVENRPGASTAIATRFVAASPADGHTILINSNSMLVNQVASASAGYDVERQLIPVVNAAWQPNIIAAAPDLPVSSLADVISLSRTRKLSYGTPGHAGISHLAGTYLFGMLAKVNILHVPYKGAAPALSAVMSKETELSFTTLPPAVPLIKSGKVKAIAVTPARRAASLPEVPTIAESGFPGSREHLHRLFPACRHPESGRRGVSSNRSQGPGHAGYQGKNCEPRV